MGSCIVAATKRFGIDQGNLDASRPSQLSYKRVRREFRPVLRLEQAADSDIVVMLVGDTVGLNYSYSRDDKVGIGWGGKRPLNEERARIRRIGYPETLAVYTNLKNIAFIAL